MSIRYECDGCGSVFKIKDSLAGTKGKCPGCQKKFIVPQKGSESGLGLEDIRDSKIEQGGRSSTPETSFADPAGPVRNGNAPSVSSGSPKESPSSKKLITEPASPPVREPGSSPRIRKERAVVPAAGSKPVPEDKPAAEGKPAPAGPPSSEIKPIPEVPAAAAPTPAESSAAQTPEVAASADAKELSPDDDFDVDSFLMDEEAAAAAKATAGLTTPTAPEAGKPQYDKQGRRMLGAALARPGSTSASPAAGAAAAAVDAALEGGQIKASPIVEAPRRRLIRFQLKGSLTLLRRRLHWIVLGAALIAASFFLTSRLMAVPLDLPVLAPVSGVVTLDGKPLAGVTVHLTPVFAQEGKSARGQRIRLRDSLGVTDDNGAFSVQYLDGVDGAPMGNVRVWIETIQLSHLKAIPPSYLSNASADIREVKEAGNEIRFELKLKSQSQ